MKKSLTIAFALVYISIYGISQTMQDTIFNYYTPNPVTIDGQADEDCWANAEWYFIDQVWMPYNAQMDQGDFEGKFKVSWDTEYLYVLVEVVDNMLSDDHSNPLQDWWNDDCLEVFIDENRSKGDHERNNNAFAYHVSLFYDAIDLNSSGNGINYKNNLDVEMDTIGSNTYLWEMAIKMYNANFNTSNPEASRVMLENKKLMGFTLAYCDNDETSSRENFIGSMYMPQSNWNDSYKNADYFGPMLLKGFDNTGIGKNQKMADIEIFPVPAGKILTIRLNSGTTGQKELSIFSLTGKLVKFMRFEGSSINLNMEDIEAGSYMLRLIDDEKSHSRIIVKE